MAHVALSKKMQYAQLMQIVVAITRIVLMENVGIIARVVLVLQIAIVIAGEYVKMGNVLHLIPAHLI